MKEHTDAIIESARKTEQSIRRMHPEMCDALTPKALADLIQSIIAQAGLVQELAGCIEKQDEIIQQLLTERERD